MDCSEDSLSPIRIRWTHDDVTVYPTSANFTYKSDKYDYLHCEFPLDVANQLRDIKRRGKLENTQPVMVKVYGEPIRTMYYESEFLSLGDDGGRLELHDLHEHLKGGVIEYSPESTSIRETYNVIYEAREDEDIFSGLDIRASGQIENEGATFSYSFPEDEKFIDVDLDYSINFQQISPLKAINKANKQFGVHTHISPTGELIVGQYDGNNVFSASNEGIEHDYHIESAGIRDVSQELETVIVEGPMAPKTDENEAPIRIGQQVEQFFQWLNPSDQDRKAGLRAHCYVTDPSVSGAEPRYVEAHDVSMSNLENVAIRMFHGLKERRQSGNIVLSGSTSSTDEAPLIGDQINIAPPVGCGLREQASYPGGDYFVAGVNHTFDNSLEMNVDVRQVPDIQELETRIVFRDVGTDQTYTKEELYSDWWT